MDFNAFWSQNWEKIAAFLAVLAFAYGLIKGIWKRAFAILHAFLTRTPYVPSKTLRIVPSPMRSWWQFGTNGGKPCVLASAEMTVTNIYGHGVTLPETYMVRPRGFGVLTAKPTPIPPQNPAEVLAMYTIIPPPKIKLGGDLKSTLVIVDQYGNKHPQKFVFRSLLPPKQ
jgi:hypothetical protein